MPYNSLLKDHFYIKIIILFVFNNYKKPIRNQRITDIVLEEFEIDYFDFQKCLYDLLSISLVRVFQEDKNNMYELTEKGKEVSTLFEDRIPYIIKQKLLFSINKGLEALEPKTAVEADVQVSHKGEFNAFLKIYEMGDLLFEINMNVGSRELAYKTKEYFLNNAQNIYQEAVKNIMKGIKE